MLKLFFCDDNAQQLALFSDFGKKAILLKEEWDISFGNACGYVLNPGFVIYPDISQ